MYRKLLFTIVTLCSFVIAQAQDYEISFAILGDAENPDSVLVENTNQQTQLMLNGTDVLLLKDTTVGIFDLAINPNRVNIYPNPVTQSAFIEYQHHNNGSVQLQLVDMNGKTLINKKEKIEQGVLLYRLSGLQAGTYVLHFVSDKNIASAVIIATQNSGAQPRLEFESTLGDSPTFNTKKHTQSIIEMHYATGDNLHLTAWLNTLNTDINLVPTESLTVEFDFTMPVALFAANETTIAVGENVEFTNQSENATSYNWIFEGGTPETSTDENPTVQYSIAGLFNVTLQAFNSLTSDTLTMTEYILVGEVPVADFSANETTVAVTTAITFTDASTNNPTQWSWNFGDGNTSTDQNPQHSYNTAGSYTVALTVTNEFGTSTETKPDYITVGEAPVANFSANETTVAVNTAITFTDASTNNPTQWSWNFGDGNTSTDQNPQHSYTTAGNYTVALTVTNQYATHTETKTDYITVEDELVLNAQALFNAVQPAGSTFNIEVEQVIDFNDLQLSNAVANFQNGAVINAASGAVVKFNFENKNYDKSNLEAVIGYFKGAGVTFKIDLTGRETTLNAQSNPFNSSIYGGGNYDAKKLISVFTGDENIANPDGYFYYDAIDQNLGGSNYNDVYSNPKIVGAMGVTIDGTIDFDGATINDRALDHLRSFYSPASGSRLPVDNFTTVDGFYMTALGTDKVTETRYSNPMNYFQFGSNVNFGSNQTVFNVITTEGSASFNLDDVAKMFRENMPNVTTSEASSKFNFASWVTWDNKFINSFDEVTGELKSGHDKACAVDASATPTTGLVIEGGNESELKLVTAEGVNYLVNNFTNFVGSNVFGNVEMITYNGSSYGFGGSVRANFISRCDVASNFSNYTVGGGNNYILNTGSVAYTCSGTGVYNMLNENISGFESNIADGRFDADQDGTGQIDEPTIHYTSGQQSTGPNSTAMKENSNSIQNVTNPSKSVLDGEKFAYNNVAPAKKGTLRINFVADNSGLTEEQIQERREFKKQLEVFRKMEAERARHREIDEAFAQRQESI